MTPEFYLCFWDEIKSMFIRALNFSWKEEVLTNSQRQLKQLKQCIVDYQGINDNREVNPHVVWETLKCVIRGESLNFSESL